MRMSKGDRWVDRPIIRRIAHETEELKDALHIYPGKRDAAFSQLRRKGRISWPASLATGPA